MIEIKKIHTTDLTKLTEIIKSCVELRLVFTVRAEHTCVEAHFTVTVYAEEQNHGTD
jgi:hypothetical protein